MGQSVSEASLPSCARHTLCPFVGVIIQQPSQASIKFRPEARPAMEQIFGKKLLAENLEVASTACKMVGRFLQRSFHGNVGEVIRPYVVNGRYFVDASPE